jgi:hypothetical protein
MMKINFIVVSLQTETLQKFCNYNVILLKSNAPRRPACCQAGRLSPSFRTQADSPRRKDKRGLRDGFVQCKVNCAGLCLKRQALL